MNPETPPAAAAALPAVGSSPNRVSPPAIFAKAAEREKAPFESDSEYAKRSIVTIMVQMLEYQIPLDGSTFELTAKGMAAPSMNRKETKAKSRLRTLIATICKCVPAEDRKWINYRKVPPTGMATIDQRTAFIKRSKEVIKCAEQVMLRAYELDYNGYLQGVHAANIEKTGSIGKPFKGRDIARINTVATQSSMVEKVNTFRNSRKSAPRPTASNMLGHFITKKT